MNQVRRDVFQAIADPTRRSIIDLLSGGNLNLNEIAGAFSVSRPAIFKQIRIPDFRAEVGFSFSFTAGTEDKVYMYECVITAVIPEKKLAYGATFLSVG